MFYYFVIGTIAAVAESNAKKDDQVRTKHSTYSFPMIMMSVTVEQLICSHFLNRVPTRDAIITKCLFGVK